MPLSLVPFFFFVPLGLLVSPCSPQQMSQRMPCACPVITNIIVASPAAPDEDGSGWSDESDEEEDEAEGGNMVSKLAASIR